VALLKKGDVSFERTQTVVLDEVDVLFSDLSFPLQPLGNACPPSTQFVFVTATLPDMITNQIKAEFPDVQYLTGPGLHRIAPTVEEVLIDCSGPIDQERSFETSFENKRKALMKVIDESNAKRTLIFCNTISQCRNVENALNRADRNNRVRDVVVYHGAIGNSERDEALIKFSQNDEELEKNIVMICTDRASRGLDFDSVAVSRFIMLYCIVLYYIVLYCIVLYCIVLYLLCCVVLYYIIFIILYLLYYIILYYIILYYIIFIILYCIVVFDESKQ
jgi:ATP-dependent RNA helicase DDX18/HAS1